MISIKFQYAAFCHLYFHEREKKLLIKQRENLIARRNVTSCHFKEVNIHTDATNWIGQNEGRKNIYIRIIRCIIVTTVYIHKALRITHTHTQR